MKLSREERELFAWGAASALVGLLLFLVRLRVEGRPLGLPLDDAWIHCAFASHLARYGQWGLFAGVPSGGESSPLWPWMLAPGELFGMRQAPRLALLWGTTFFLALPGLGAMLASTPTRRRALAVALGLCGPLLFHALSGMETLPALTLGLAALWRMRAEDLRGSALFAGAACWMRPDLWLLLVWILLVGSRQLKTEPGRRTIWPGSIGRWAPGAVLGGLAVLTLSVAEASFPPTTLAGRRWLMGLSPDLQLAGLGQGSFELLLSWVRAIGADFGLGRVAFAHPGGLTDLLRGWWKLSFGLAALAGFLHLLRHDPHGDRRAARLLLLWTLTVILFYALVLPTRGHVGRYQAMLYPLLLLFVVEGVASFSHWGRTRAVRVALSTLIGLPLVFGLVAGCVEASGLWGDAVQHIERVHLRAAGDLEDGLPEGTVLGVFDVGAVAYVYEGEMIDLSGLSDPLLTRTLPHARDGAMASLLYQRGMDEVILPVLDDANELAFATRLGLFGGDPRRPTFGRGARLVELGRWGSTVEEWGPAFHFSGNAFRELRLYRWELPRR